MVPRKACGLAQTGGFCEPVLTARLRAALQQFRGIWWVSGWFFTSENAKSGLLLKL